MCDHQSATICFERMDLAYCERQAPSFCALLFTFRFSEARTSPFTTVFSYTAEATRMGLMQAFKAYSLQLLI